MRLPSPAGGVLAAALLLLLLSSRALCDCPTPDLPPHSGLRGGGPLQVAYPVGTTLHFRCIPGYEHIPGITPSITCLNNSTWSTVPTFCQGRRCPVPNLPNGRITSSNDLRLGEEVTFACDYGFRLIGQATIRCVLRAGVVDWNRDVPFCQRIPCVRPAIIPNGHYNPDPMDSYEAGSAVTYWCDPDLSLIGNATITCTVAPDGLNGMWDHPPPECKKVTCRRPYIQNGRLKTTFVAQYTYGDSVSLECNPTYTLVGASFITCGADNNWHPPVPNCIKSAVPPVPPVHPPQPPVPPVPPVHPPQPPIPPVPPVHPPQPPIPPVPPVHPPQPPIPPVPVTVPPAEGGTEEDLPSFPTPSETTPSDESGSWEIIAISLGSVASVLLLSCCIFAAGKKFPGQRKTDPPPTTEPSRAFSDVDYNVVSEGDMKFEELYDQQ